MNHSPKHPTRREALAGLIVLPALAGVLFTSTAIAEAKGSKTQFKYQTTPKSGQQCSGCALFVPGSSKTAAGACKVVDGSISPTGWCTAFAKKT